LRGDKISVVCKPFIIIDVKEKKTNPINPGLSIFEITAVLKDWAEKSHKGRKLLKKLKLEEYMGVLDAEYLDTTEAFTTKIPASGKTLEWSKYHVGNEIMIAYYPTNVWATFHANGEKDNTDDRRRFENGK